MTEQNQENQSRSLEDRLLNIGDLYKISRIIEKSKSPGQRSNLFNQLASSLAVKDKANEREILRNTNYDSLEDMYLSHMRYGPETAMSFASQGSAQELTQAEPLYKENKNKIIGEVIGSIKDTLQKKAQNKAEAALILSQYLEGLLGDASELDQTTADRYARNQLEGTAGMYGLYDARGSVEGYRGIHEQNDLMKRILASEYLQDIKDNEGKVTGYKLNEEKLVTSMEDIKYGAIAYTNTKLIEKAKAEQAAKEANKKAS